MTSRTKNVDLDAWFANTLGGAGNGNGNKMSVGMGNSSWAWQQRFAIRIPRGTLFDGIPSAAAISAFKIWLRGNSGNSGIGASPNFYLERATGTFTAYQLAAGSGGVPAGGNINAFVSSSGPASGEWPGPATVTTDRAQWTGSIAADQWRAVDALALGRWWYSNPSVANLILLAKAVDENDTAQRATFYTADSASIPYAELTFGGNSPPNKPTDPAVTYGADGTSFTLTTTYTDPDGDTSTKYELRYEPD